MRIEKHRILASAAAGLFVVSSYCYAASLTMAPEPVAGAYVDTYRQSVPKGTTAAGNPVGRILLHFLDYWQPGENGQPGKELAPAVLQYDLARIRWFSTHRTAEQEQEDVYYAWNPTDSVRLQGLGTEEANYQAAGEKVAHIAQLGELMANFDTEGLARTKGAFRYPRPFRRDDSIRLNPQLAENARAHKPETDYGFSSGHTFRGYMAALGYAYVFPERYQAFLKVASDIGISRNRAGLHNCLDVMGGRMVGTATAAALFCDQKNHQLLLDARTEGEVFLRSLVDQHKTVVTVADKRAYEERLTYGFAPVGSVDQPMRVPKGAEVLLATRFPYLSAEARRLVLATTGLPSGYPLLDDEEGWGRLNLWRAADGFGALPSEVRVTMKAENQGFSARDCWRNDIYGEGRLVKAGDGVLVLSGANSYTGGTRIEGGSIWAENRTALGAGKTEVSVGKLYENTEGPLELAGLHLEKKSELVLTVRKPEDIVCINGSAKLAGTLLVKLAADWKPQTQPLIQCNDLHQGDFAQVRLEGVPDGVKARTVWQGKQFLLKVD
ncbi:phosphatase PAP2 family protein [Anaerovibrio lipolyticus]|uniref:autotransporter-associated beta strand repeat-containing protein n=1 Tax=Anaerovibrio lipolyticus TaxID=82374 RepID=UPI0026F08E63|nr:phosphatase PAP2 family protein [Anaerovibrio lipolyticus]